MIKANSKKTIFLLAISIILTSSPLIGSPSVNELRTISVTLEEYLHKGKEKGISLAKQQLSTGDYPNYSEATKLTLQYLSDDNSISEDDIQEACQENPFTWPLSCIAFFVHTFAVDHNREIGDFDFYIRCYTENFDYLKSQNSAEIGGLVKEIGTWEKRVAKWDRWQKAGLTSQEDLEPLFAGKIDTDWVSAMDMSTITLPAYLLSRKYFKERPTFNAYKPNITKFKAYLSSIEDKELKALETERAKMVIKFKTILIKMINHCGYTGTIGSGKRRVKGTTTSATSKSFTVKRTSGVRVSRRWSDLTSEQSIEILKYCSSTLKDYRKDAALILDWFGEHEAAFHFAKAAKRDEDKEFFNKYLLGKVN